MKSSDNQPTAKCDANGVEEAINTSAKRRKCPASYENDVIDSFDTILISQIVPATCLSFRPGSKTDYIIGTVAGVILLVIYFLSSFIYLITER